MRANRDGYLDWRRDILLTNDRQSLGYAVRATDYGGCVFTGHTAFGSVGNLDLLFVKVEGGT